MPILINKDKNIGIEIHYELTKENSFFEYNKIFENNEKIIAIIPKFYNYDKIFDNYNKIY